MPLSSIFQGIGALSSIINTAQTNRLNIHMQRETNKANRELVQMQNKAAAEESEKAYKRSSAPNQVALMTSAGMSRAGAINALNGGGSYTPAPVNTSQDAAPQSQPIDFSGLSNLAQIISSEKQQKRQIESSEKLANAQIEANKIEAQKQREHELVLKDIDSSNTRRGQDLDYKKHLENLGFERDKWNYLAPLQKEQLRVFVLP